MMSKETPLQQVKNQHGSKEKLVDKVVGLMDRGEESKDAFRARLLTISNAKLQRLFAISTEVKEKFGGKDKLVDAVLGLMNRAKDADYREKLLAFTPNRLIDLYRTWQKKAKRG